MKKILSVRITAVTIAAVVLIVLALTSFRNSVKEDFILDIYSRLSELSGNNAASINSKIDDQFEMMRTMASYLVEEDLQSEKVKSMLGKTVSSYGYLRGAITFPDGSLVTHDDKKAPEKKDGEEKTAEYIIKGFQGISSVTGPMPAVVDPTKTVILLTEPIYNGEEIVALLTFTYETSYLDTAFHATSFNGSGYSYIMDKNGDVISRPKNGIPTFTGSNMLDFIKEQCFDCYGKVTEDINVMKTDTVLANFGGRQKYISYQPLGINQWYVLSVTSTEVLDRQLNGVLNDVYLLSSAIIIVIFLFIFSIWLYIYSLQQKATKELEKLAYYDSLTGIPNQNMFEKEARRILDREQNQYAYIILNVNKFKMINEIFGFSEGDKLLQFIADVLREEADGEEVCARFDADIFHILSVYTCKENLDRRMVSVAKKISEYSFDKKTYHQLSVGFGAYIIEDKTRSISFMGDKARMALSKVKGIHTPTTYFYNREIIDQFMAEQEIENSMQTALDQGEMHVYLQPKCSAETYELRSAEALVRWVHPVKGIIMPDTFIPLFEKNGFIVNLDMYMVEAVCKKLQEWKNKGWNLISISVNQSRECLYQPHYISELVSILKRYDISPSFIEIEVTERAFFEDETALINIIERLHDYGFMVAMDDFGVGYSSLNMLQDVQVDVLKLDKNFFKESINSQRGKKIVSNIVAMANDLGIEVVAEGIETREQLEFLQEIHCESVQGYYFSRPISTAQFEDKYLETLTL